MYKRKCAHTEENVPVEDRMDRVLKPHCREMEDDENNDDDDNNDRRDQRSQVS